MASQNEAQKKAQCGFLSQAAEFFTKFVHLEGVLGVLESRNKDILGYTKILALNVAPGCACPQSLVNQKRSKD